MKRWYVIQTKPKKEDGVIALLSKAQFELFFPRLRALLSFKPLFPSYLFVRTDFTDPSLHRLIRFTRGVNKILGDTETPYPVPDQLVEALRERTSNGNLIEQSLLFKEGDEVRVKKGILKDLAGIIERNIPDAGRVKVLFKWLNANMRAVLRYTELEKDGLIGTLFMVKGPKGQHFGFIEESNWIQWR